MTASSLASVSLQPPLISVCVDREADMHDLIVAAPEFVVNILESGQEELSRRFADKHEDRFDGVGLPARARRARSCSTAPWRTSSASASPRIPAATTPSSSGRVVGGDTRDGHPLLYYRGGYAALT